MEVRVEESWRLVESIIETRFGWTVNNEKKALCTFVVCEIVCNVIVAATIRERNRIKW